MPDRTDATVRGLSPSESSALRFAAIRPISRCVSAFHEVVSRQWLVHLTIVFLAYVIAGKLGQATTNIRSSNLGPVWPAYGVALAAFLGYGYRVWPGIAASAFLVASQGSVSPLAAAGQATGATVAAVTGTYLLRRISQFDPSLSRLRDALGLILLGAFGSAILSASIGIVSLYATGIQPYSGLSSAWIIYWLGDSTGVLLITPLIFTLPQLFRLQSRARIVELAALVMVLIAACVVIFGDLPLFSIRLNVLAFAVTPFVMWGAINFGIAGATLSVFIIATIATLLTALGRGPFSGNTPFTNAALLDVLFIVLALSGLALAALIAERERAEHDREQLIREQIANEALSRLSGKLMDAQESERARISRELHDDIGQRLGLLTVQLNDLLPGSPDIPRRVVELQRHASEIAADVQSLSHELHSSKLELLGVATTMKLFCGEFSGQQNVTVDFEAGDVPSGVPTATSLNLFRVLQEALHNSAKHSAARQYAVRLWAADGWIHLVVSDGGVGFDVEAAKRGRGLGLVSMEERLKLVGGHLTIESQPRRGTAIRARVRY
jgi:signal transduction histidine kinase